MTDRQRQRVCYLLFAVAVLCLAYIGWDLGGETFHR